MLRLFYIHQQMKQTSKEAESTYIHRYLQWTDENDVVSTLTDNQKYILEFYNSIQEVQSNLRYQADKWSIKEIVQHCIDVERIFTYRALCFARNEQTPLPGFDENDYAQSAQADKRNWNDLCNEMLTVRQSSILLYRSFDEKSLLQPGTANNLSINAHTLGRLIAGHWIHHINVIKERYL